MYWQWQLALTVFLPFSVFYLWCYRNFVVLIWCIYVITVEISSAESATAALRSSLSQKKGLLSDPAVQACYIWGFSMKESMRKCFKCGLSAADPDVVLFRFPNPGVRNTVRCELWAKFVFPNGPWHSPEFQKKLYLEHRMLCSKHFDITSFSDFSQKKLFRDASPKENCVEVNVVKHPIDVSAPDPSQVLLSDITNSKINLDCNSSTGVNVVNHPIDVSAPDPLQVLLSDITNSKINLDCNSSTGDTMWYLNACRSCLTTRGKLIRIGQQARKLFCIITELELDESDGFPQYFCAECFVLIKKALLFRRRSRRAHFVLKEIYAVRKQVAQADVEIVDRHKTNLISPYSLWKPENAVAYSYKTEDAEEIQSEEITPDIEAVLKESLATDNHNKFDIKCDANEKSIKIEHVGQPSVQNNNTVDLIVSEVITEKAEKLVKQKVDILNTSSILVDIKPANWREIEKEEEERQKKQKLAEIEAELLDIHGDDFYDDDTANNDFVPEDIDMDDVFKGLKEESSKESESEPEPVSEVDPEPKPATVKRKQSYYKRVVDEGNTSAALYFIDGVRTTQILEYAFTYMQIKLQTLQEQREAFNKVLSTEPFCRAMFKCNICVMVYSDVNVLYKHVDYHNAKLKYEFGCQVCADRFRTEEQLNQHAAFSHWYLYQCGRCGGSHNALDSVAKCFKAMKNPTQFEKHFKTRPLSPKAIYSTLDSWTGNEKSAHGACQQCKIYFRGKKSYKLHMERHSGSLLLFGKHFECDVCSLKFPNRQKLAAHLASWHLFRYSCRRCKVQFLNRTQAKDHMAHGSCSLMCYVCNTFFESKSKRFTHIYSAHRSDCGVCGEYFTSHVKMYIHQFKMHGYFRLNTEAELYDVRFFCKDCGVYFMDEKLLFQHLCRMRHDAAKEYENGCRSCMLLFDSPEERAEHRLTCENTYPKQCEFCTTIVPDKDSYQEHKISQHKHRAPVIPLAGDSRLCDVCGKTVKHIKQHVRTHTVAAEIAVQCKFCPAKSLSYTQHVSHVIFNHTAKPYKCTLCQLKFLYRSSCREHILKTHAPVMLYGCEACARRFSHLDYLHDHCRKTHNVDLKKQDKSVFLSKRMFGKIYTYPHMKIDGSHIDLSILERTPIELCDYLDENEKRVPYTDAFFFDPNVDPLTPSGTQPKKKKNKKKNKEQTKALYLRRKLRNQMRAAMKENVLQNMPSIEPIEIDNDKTVQETSEDVIVGDTDNGVNESTDINDQEMEVETEDIVGQLIERDGRYYVLANDVLYTLEDDCVDRLQEKDGVMQIVNE